MNIDNFNTNDINVQVYQLLDDLDTMGMKSAPRGKKVVEAMLCTLDINPTMPIMDFPDRKFNYKYFAGELAWYLKGESHIDFIINFSSFWNGLKNPDGTINSNYGNILLNPHPSTVETTSIIQLEWVYNSLVKDKDSRQAIAFLNCPYYQFDGNKDFVCTCYLNFWIRKDYLDMKVQMRSNDIFFGLTYDAPWFSALHQSLFLNLKQVYPDLKLGMYHHCADNIHYYERHFDLVSDILSKSPTPSPEFILKEPLFYFKDNKLYLSDNSKNYIKCIEEVVDTQSLHSMNDQEWKQMITSVLKISL